MCALNKRCERLNSVEMGGEQFLKADLEQQCWASRHILYVMFIGIPCVLLYVIGIPGKRK